MKPERIELELASLPGWVADALKQSIWRTFEFCTWGEASAFAAAVIEEASGQGRSPEIDLRYSGGGGEQTLVTVRIVSADLVDADFRFARRVQALGPPSAAGPSDSP